MAIGSGTFNPQAYWQASLAAFMEQPVEYLEGAAAALLGTSTAHAQELEAPHAQQESNATEANPHCEHITAHKAMAASEMGAGAMFLGLTALLAYTGVSSARMAANYTFLRAAQQYWKPVGLTALASVPISSMGIHEWREAKQLEMSCHAKTTSQTLAAPSDL